MYEINTDAYNLYYHINVGDGMNYVEKIKKARIKNKISQVELSEMLGLSSSAYGLFETYQRHMDVETFAKICKILKLSADKILDIN